jgi:hypothetical protein
MGLNFQNLYGSNTFGYTGVEDWSSYLLEMIQIESLWKMLTAKIIQLYPELAIMNDRNTTV